MGVNMCIKSLNFINTQAFSKNKTVKFFKY